MIKIEFDGIIYALQKFGGASVYWKSIVERVRLDHRFDLTEIHSSKISRGIPVRTKADVFHSSHFRTTTLSRAKTVTTVHDLTYELGLLGNGLKAKLNIFERKRSYFSADAIVCISENTKQDLLDIYPILSGRCPIFVIHHGFITPKLDGKALPSGLRDPGYVLYVGGRNNYKNFLLAVDGFVMSGLWKNGFKFVCTGTAFSAQELQLFRKMGIEQSFLNVGLVDDSVLFRLYKHAHCLLYTSKYEGFGLPLIEAMSAGCPVIGSDASCIPEIVGKAGILVNQDAPDQLARAILDLGNEALRSRVVESGLIRSSHFSWESSALRHMEVYASLAANK